MLLKPVICVYASQEITERTDKIKRHDYKNGGFTLVTTKTETIKSSIFALLSCGHTRKQHPHESLKGSKRLSCFYCDGIEWTNHQIAKTEPMSGHEWNDRKRDQEKSSLENLALAAKHRIQCVLTDEK